MFKKEKKEVDSVTIYTLIDTETTVSGDIVSDSNVRIDGTLNGSIKIGGKLVVGSSGVITGKVTCQTADIAGKLKSNIYTDMLILKSTAEIEGDITTIKLAIEQGVVFTGNCSMHSPDTSIT